MHQHIGEETRINAAMGKNKTHVATLSETQRNIGGMEKAGPWGKFVCFFSTGIDPKRRDANEKGRDN